MLADRARIEIRAGAGGDGSLSFRRVAHVPKGGPDGGDGGRGGDVVLRCDDNLRDLQGFRRRAHFRAERGGHGQGAQRHGADGDPLVIPVPPGTEVARLTRAQPKVAAYPFTTLEPVLGTLEADDRQLVIADIPGLIEGASGGAGLGHDFLAHVERTRLLVHVLDLAPLDGSDPVENFATVERELAEHDPRLADLPRILALSKADLVAPEAAEAAAAGWRRRPPPPAPGG